VRSKSSRQLRRGQDYGKATVTFIETIAQRNEDFVDSGYSADLKIIPSTKSIIIGCSDPRVDPMDILGLEPGEAAIYRNIGGARQYRINRNHDIASNRHQGCRPGNGHWLEPRHPPSHGLRNRRLF
jgi:hypothetical protein